MRYCDIVMKGGVTSGIVYPAAVFEIAKRFVFKNVGGTSAGAIAAVLTAAAEFRRATTGETSGFALLGEIPNLLAQDSLLFRLFHPNPPTRSLYHTVLALAGRQHFKPAWLSRLVLLVRAYPFASFVGAATGLALLTAVVLLHSGAVAILCTALLIFVGIAVADVLALVKDLLTSLPPNYFGLITGMETSGDDPVLTTWLYEKVQEVAGLGPHDPLTFAMLWQGTKTPDKDLRESPKEPVINLEMVTTNVSLGRPYRWPTFTNEFYFSKNVMLDFFPQPVITWMESRSRKADPSNPEQIERHRVHAGQGLFPLPHAGDLPVIVPTRMSLAFPVLLSAVPLYSVDFSDPSNQNTDLPALERCWFSDGGLSSNFPIALFDAPLPRWPTFAINLQQFPTWRQPSENEGENVYMPRTNAAGRLPAWARFANVPGFLGAIFTTMQNWHDVTLTPLPGYRDRIVTIFMSKDEGGLNLDMPLPILQRLRERGAAAGSTIAARFDDPAPGLPQSDAPKMNWTNHREERYLTTIGAAMAYLCEYAEAYDNPRPGDVGYDALIPQNDPALAYAAGELEKAGTALTSSIDVRTRVPRPLPELAIGPRLDS